MRSFLVIEMGGLGSRGCGFFWYSFFARDCVCVYASKIPKKKKKNHLVGRTLWRFGNGHLIGPHSLWWWWWWWWQQGSNVKVVKGDGTTASDPSDALAISRAYPYTYAQPLVHLEAADAGPVKHPSIRFLFWQGAFCQKFLSSSAIFFSCHCLFLFNSVERIPEQYWEAIWWHGDFFSISLDINMSLAHRTPFVVKVFYVRRDCWSGSSQECSYVGFYLRHSQVEGTWRWWDEVYWWFLIVWIMEEGLLEQWFYLFIYLPPPLVSLMSSYLSADWVWYFVAGNHLEVIISSRVCLMQWRSTTVRVLWLDLLVSECFKHCAALWNCWCWMWISLQELSSFIAQMHEDFAKNPRKRVSFVQILSLVVCLTKHTLAVLIEIHQEITQYNWVQTDHWWIIIQRINWCGENVVACWN
jgi:hypothetical protein